MEKMKVVLGVIFWPVACLFLPNFEAKLAAFLGGFTMVLSSVFFFWQGLNAFFSQDQLILGCGLAVLGSLSFPFYARGGARYLGILRSRQQESGLSDTLKKMKEHGRRAKAIGNVAGLPPV